MIFASDLIGRTIVAAADSCCSRMLLRLDNGTIVEIEAEREDRETARKQAVEMWPDFGELGGKGFIDNGG